MPTTTTTPAIFPSLQPFLEIWESPKSVAFRLKLKSSGREELIDKFREAFSGKKRLTALLLADALIERGIPPLFWHHHLSKSVYCLEQIYDLLAYDIRWLRERYRDHHTQIRYKRYRLLFGRSEIHFHRETEFAFYQGRRAPGQIVRAMSLTEQQQWDCWWLRSARIVKLSAIVESKRSGVFAILQNAINGGRRTATFSNDDAKTALIRRHRLWLCSQIAGGKPSETARRYEQMTGEILSRQVVANQLKNIETTLETERIALLQ